MANLEKTLGSAILASALGRRLFAPDDHRVFGVFFDKVPRKIIRVISVSKIKRGLVAVVGA